MKFKGQNHAKLPARPVRAGLSPVSRSIQPIQLETSFMEEPVHHRWLLTSCLAGAAATLVVGGLMLGLFGHNAAPPQANAAINRNADEVLTRSTAKRETEDNIAAATSPSGATTEVLPERELEGAWAYPEINENELAYSEGDTTVLDSEIDTVDSENNNITEISKSPPPEPVDERFKLAKGSTLKRELIDRGVSKAAAEELVRAIEPVVAMKSIKSGTEVDVTFDRQIDFYGREVTFPVELSFKSSAKQTVLVTADEDGNFEVSVTGKAEEPVIASKPDDKKTETPPAVVAEHFRAQAKIGPGIYSTAKDNKIPDYIISEFTRVFSYDVDFQNQVGANDSFEILFGKPLTGTSTKRKVMLFAKLNVDGKPKNYFRFTSSDGSTEYYDENGRSAARAILKTPVSGYKLTSGFGMRRHPLLRYSKMHTGVDFGAPKGTPIRAASTGIVDLAGRHGAYGNTIVLKHGTKYKTLYAHMSRLAAGIRPGIKVNQGQVIGYVGSTGRSTGPHLHYEVRINNRPVNPTSIKAAGGKQLAGKDLINFRATKNRVLAMMKQAPASTQLAQAGQ
jgi:murein DD-endopeptidase MepM/ murein hydrolase activator NlpD